VSVILRASEAPTLAFARSHTLITRSPPPVANISLVGSMATLRTQPKCEDNTVESFHGACQEGVGMFVSCLDLTKIPCGLSSSDSFCSCSLSKYSSGRLIQSRRAFRLSPCIGDDERSRLFLIYSGTTCRLYCVRRRRAIAISCKVSINRRKKSILWRAIK
jgi:hypothetical protein